MAFRALGWETALRWDDNDTSNFEDDSVGYHPVEQSDLFTFTTMNVQSFRFTIDVFHVQADVLTDT